MDSVAQMTNAGNRTHAFWMIAESQASAGDATGARESIESALKGGMDPMEIAMDACGVAGGMARTGGPTVDLSWIERLDTPIEKSLAYAGAASGIVEGSDQK
jgi:hypothetical protein